MASAANSLPEDQPRRVQLSLLPDDIAEDPVEADPVAEALADLQRTDAIGLELAAGKKPTIKACKAAGLGVSWGSTRWQEIKDLEPAALAENQLAKATELAELRASMAQGAAGQQNGADRR